MTSRNGRGLRRKVGKGWERAENREKCRKGGDNGGGLWYGMEVNTARDGTVEVNTKLSVVVYGAYIYGKLRKYHDIDCPITNTGCFSPTGFLLWAQAKAAEQ